MKTNLSKQKVIDAASLLFYQKGYHGTSVRDIAEKAAVNVSLISYYFKGKQGLFEYAVIEYYEDYLRTIEEILQHDETMSALEKLKNLTRFIIQYKQNNLQLSCLIHRELSLDTIFVREMAVTYLAKENYCIRKALFDTLTEQKWRKGDRKYILMQLKGMLITPYILHNEWKYQVIGEYSHEIFINKYVKTIHNWIDFIIS